MTGEEIARTGARITVREARRTTCAGLLFVGTMS